MKLLIVDDHVLFREGLVSLIARQPDMQVIGEAGTVQEAVKKASQLRPDLILMDFNLPDGTGLDATRQILAEQPHCPIIFLTVYEEDERLFGAIRLGARGYLLKNIPVADLLAALRTVEQGQPALSPQMVNRLMGEFATGAGSSSRTAEALTRLSGRELEVLHELARGVSNRQIADKLYISENTVRNHVHNILEKLGLKSRRQAIGLLKDQGAGK
jgi:DNA-binding NarL/FixJ family response regulator